MFKRIVSVLLSAAILLTPFNALGIAKLNHIMPTNKLKPNINIMNITTPNINNISVLASETYSPKQLFSVSLDEDAYSDFLISVAEKAYKYRENLTNVVPEEYKDYIDRLKELHPNWSFEFFDTELDWNTAVAGQNVIRRNSVTGSRPLSYRSTELGYGMITETYEGYIPMSNILQKDGKSIVICDSKINLMNLPGKSHEVVFTIPNGEIIKVGETVPCDDEQSPELITDWAKVIYEYKYEDYIPVEGKNWYQASVSLIKFSLDPRNFLNDESVYMFEDLNYNYDLEYSLDDVKMALKGTFMDDKYIKDNNDNEVLYAEAILLASEIYNINPNHLISRIIQEVSPKGCATTTGRCGAYPGIYNFYNIGAHSGYLDGLSWASSSGSYGRPWTSEYKSILGGAEFLSNEYIGKGQNTLYFEKFAVTDKKGDTGHQYMANIEAPVSESKYVYNSYKANDLLDNKYVFIIPVYKNLPKEVSTM